MIDFYGLFLAGLFICIGLHRVANAIDGMTQVLKDET